jgi:peptidyl-dipeptidase A
MRRLATAFAPPLLLSVIAACTHPADPNVAGGASAESAEAFVARANAEFQDIWIELNAADWVRSTYITHDTAIVSSLANERFAEWHGRMVEQAAQYDGQNMSAETRRALDLLKLSSSLPSPKDASKRKELSALAADLEGSYGAAKYCPSDGACLSGSELEGLMQTSRNYDDLLEYWVGWREAAKPMRPKFERYVELANEGARELGYGDLGEMWRSAYDMSAADFSAAAKRLWQQVRPLYEELHCHVRAKLAGHYGEDQVPLDQPIPAHLLGNMWAQGWSFLFDLVEPYPGIADLDVDSVLRTKNYSPEEMVRSAENFYVSLGMDRLPDTFWQRSMFSKPADREVVCHASAWTMDGGDDLRIKMCIKQTYDELRVIYHELGHNYYQWAYKNQPTLFRDGAHAGFHEAIGDTVTLSMTPEYLEEVGLLAPAEQSREAVINRQMMMALDNVAFLPFGKLIDEWRWKVFSGEVTAENYNQAWWELRTAYQGVAPPVQRSEADFDPGSKYHIPANVSYTRYFLAQVLQFQFQRALCEAMAHEAELHACSVYGSEEAGKRLWSMLEAGASEPWQDTLEKLTGTREMDATAIIEYFAPLMEYLQEQNATRQCGW